MRTVIVDDDGLVAISLKTILEAQGIEVAATGNDGKEAIELYHQYHPDKKLSETFRSHTRSTDIAEYKILESPQRRYPLILRKKVRSTFPLFFHA